MCRTFQCLRADFFAFRFVSDFRRRQPIATIQEIFTDGSSETKCPSPPKRNALPKRAQKPPEGSRRNLRDTGGEKNVRRSGMASGKKTFARRGALRSCPQSGHRAAAARCPRALKPRVRSADQVRQIAASIKVSGFTGPVLFAGGNTVIAGARPCAMARAGGIARPRLRAGHIRTDVGMPVADDRIDMCRTGPPCNATAGKAGNDTMDSPALPADRRPVPHRNRSPAGNCGPAHCHRQVPVPGQFFPCISPEFPEKSGRDRLAAYCPHSQPYWHFYPLQIWSGFMPCYQQVENRCFQQRRFTRADIPPGYPKVSTGVFHHPFRVFRPE